MNTPDPSNLEAATIRISNRREEIDRAEETLLGVLEGMGYPESARFSVRLALEEALANAFHHGHRGLPPHEPVVLDYTVGLTEVVMSVEDKGPGFAPDRVPDPTLQENLELPTGRGLLLMRAYMASVRFNGRGNRVTMVYRRPGPGPRQVLTREPGE